MNSLTELRGKILVCHCRQGQPCHADALMEALDHMDSNINRPSRLTLRLLFLFAGVRRKADVRHHLQELCDAKLYILDMHERDLELHGEADDLLDSDVWQDSLQKLQNGSYDILMATPPCNTHTRAVWSNRKGPKPVRSREHPYGYPWLRGHAKQKCEDANLLIDRTFAAARAGHQSKAATRYLLEHPEDLGTTSTSGRLASIWQLSETRDLRHRRHHWSSSPMSFRARASKAHEAGGHAAHPAPQPAHRLAVLHKARRLHWPAATLLWP